MSKSTVFDLLGPVMVGPSSSHTAGAVRLGLMAANILGEPLQEVRMTLHGSFAQTGKGHGTHLALVAGLLGMQPDNEDIKNSIRIAEEMKIRIEFLDKDLGNVHPNTVRFDLKGVKDKKKIVTGSSVGGGRIAVNRVDEFDVEFNGTYPTLIILYADYPGMVAEITSLLAETFVNIAQMRVSREGKGRKALSVIETDQPVKKTIISAIANMPKVEQVMFIERLI